MDNNSYDLEFFDFENASEEEIKEIQAILKGPGSNGSVELPWEINLQEAAKEPNPIDNGVSNKDPLISEKNSKSIEGMISPAINYTTQPTSLSTPVARLPPPTMEPYIAPPTTVGPYPNPSYFVSRTIPYLRAYPHMGVPFFACPIPGAAGESSPLPSPYGQFVPVVPAQEKFMGPVEIEQKNKSSDRQCNRRNRKKPSSDYCNNSFESETVAAYGESVPADEQPAISSPVSTTGNNERPTSVPLVPLPVPPSTFAVAGSTLPLHSYPPGLHTLPYTQMSAPQAPSAAMYYVPVFNHPYGSYLPSPPSAPMVIPVSIQPETASPVVNTSSAAIPEPPPVVPFSKSSDESTTPHVQSHSEPEQSEEEAKHTCVDSAAKNASEGEDVTDCNSSSDYPMSKSSSPDCIPDTGIADDCYEMCPSQDEKKHAVRDPSRCWADLFKKPGPQVNGIDRHPSNQQKPGINTLKKDVLNGKVYIPPSSDVH